MNADRFFTDAEKERIQQAVLAAETKTAGEIVPIIVTASARYTEIELLGLVGGLFVGIIIEWFWSDPWGSKYLNLWPVTCAAVGFFIGRIGAVKRLAASTNRISEAVHMLALASFSEHGLHYTREHTGILILVSLLEHRVEVLADRGINAKVEKGTWEEIVHILTAGLKSNHACDAFCKAIERCGEILATHFPRAADDKDELPNRLVTR
ncbi:MAG TPA: TPM domain-containing protein [Candidatus Binatia bacterium]|nr:TPM domain-containing protein [Candidatus Binatia bacterium]